MGHRMPTRVKVQNGGTRRKWGKSLFKNIYWNIEVMEKEGITCQTGPWITCQIGPFEPFKRQKIGVTRTFREHNFWPIQRGINLNEFGLTISNSPLSMIFSMMDFCTLAHFFQQYIIRTLQHPSAGDPGRRSFWSAQRWRARSGISGLRLRSELIIDQTTYFWVS